MAKKETLFGVHDASIQGEKVLRANVQAYIRIGHFVVLKCPAG